VPVGAIFLPVAHFFRPQPTTADRSELPAKDEVLDALLEEGAFAQAQALATSDRG
jgi:hypothetical protein